MRLGNWVDGMTDGGKEGSGGLVVGDYLEVAPEDLQGIKRQKLTFRQATRLQGTAPFLHPKPKKKPRYPYTNRKKPAGF